MKYLLAQVLIVTSLLIQAQTENDTSYLPTIYLEEIVVFDKQLKEKSFGYLRKDNFTFSLYKDYEIGVYIDNPEKLENIVNFHFKVQNELKNELAIEINFYEFNGTPEKLIRSLDAVVKPSKKNKLIISNKGNTNLKFPNNGIFISTKIKSKLTKEDAEHFKVYFSQKYESEATFIRGSIYGKEWIELSNLKLRPGKTINVCYGIIAN